MDLHLQHHGCWKEEDVWEVKPFACDPGQFRLQPTGGGPTNGVGGLREQESALGDILALVEDYYRTDSGVPEQSNYLEGEVSYQAFIDEITPRDDLLQDSYPGSSSCFSCLEGENLKPDYCGTSAGEVHCGDSPCDFPLWAEPLSPPGSAGIEEVHDEVPYIPNNDGIAVGTMKIFANDKVENGMLTIYLTDSEDDTKHTPDVVFSALKCSVCKCPFHKESHLEEHMRKVHFVLRLQKCTRCDYYSGNGKKLKRHMDRRHGRLHCGLCSFRTDRGEEMRRHRKDCHRKEESREEGGPLVCSLCCQRASGKEQMGRHLRCHFKTWVPQQPRCLFCPFSSESNSELIHHLVEHLIQDAALSRSLLFQSVLLPVLKR